MTLGNGAASNAVQPGAKALVIAQVGQRALRAQEDVLQHILDLGSRHAPRYERPKSFFDLSMGAARGVADHCFPAPGLQHSGPQHEAVSAGLVASIVAETT